MSNRSHDYGKCHVCGSKLRRSLRNEIFRRGRALILVKDVPVGVCRDCGASVMTAPVAKQVERLIRRGKGRPQTIISVTCNGR